MTNDQLNSTGYIVVDGEVIAITYREYLNNYDDGENKLFAVELMEEQYQQFGSNKTIFEIWYQRINRQAERSGHGEFDSEEDAELFIYDRIAWWINEKNWNAPIFWCMKEEAADDIIEAMADYMDIDKDVAASIYSKKIRVDAKRKELAIARRTKITAEYEARKAWLATAVPAEADAIEIDNAFIEDMKVASQLSGNEKSSHCARSFKALLERNNIIEIKTDFWQIFRILKAKAEKL